MPNKKISELEEISLKIEGVKNQLGLLHEVGAEGVNSLDNYTMSIWLMEFNLDDYCKQLKELLKELAKERTK